MMVSSCYISRVRVAILKNSRMTLDLIVEKSCELLIIELVTLTFEESCLTANVRKKAQRSRCEQWPTSQRLQVGTVSSPSCCLL